MSGKATPGKADSTSAFSRSICKATMDWEGVHLCTNLTWGLRVWKQLGPAPNPCQSLPRILLLDAQHPSNRATGLTMTPGQALLPSCLAKGQGTLHPPGHGDPLTPCSTVTNRASRLPSQDCVYSSPAEASATAKMLGMHLKLSNRQQKLVPTSPAIFKTPPFQARRELEPEKSVLFDHIYLQRSLKAKNMKGH